jgi:hypothetical protein
VRIRQIKPDYWRDEVIASMPDSVSRFYIGMWQEADDAGWLRWNVAEIALDLYGYEPRIRREKWVTERGKALEEAGRLLFFDCGHAFVPKLTKHQKFGGRPVYTQRDAHARECAPTREDAPHGIGRERVEVGNGTERKGRPVDTYDEKLANVIGPDRLDRIRRKAAGE